MLTLRLSIRSLIFLEKTQCHGLADPQVVCKKGGSMEPPLDPTLSLLLQTQHSFNYHGKGSLALSFPWTTLPMVIQNILVGS